jgi:hypothetical protein
MTSLVVARNESNRATNSNNNNSKQHTHETNYFGGRTGCMIQRLSAAAAAEQHPISRIVRKCHSTSTHALGHFSAAVEPIAAAQSIIRRQGQYYCCWRQLIRAVDIHTMEIQPMRSMPAIQSCWWTGVHYYHARLTSKSKQKFNQRYLANNRSRINQLHHQHY